MEKYRNRICYINIDNGYFFTKNILSEIYINKKCYNYENEYVIPENISTERFCPENGIYFSHSLFYSLFEMLMRRKIKNQYSLNEIPLSHKLLKDYILSDKIINLFCKEI